MFKMGKPLPTVAYVLKGEPVPFRDLFHAVADFGGFDEVCSTSTCALNLMSQPFSD